MGRLKVPRPRAPLLWVWRPPLDSSQEEVATWGKGRPPAAVQDSGQEWPRAPWSRPGNGPSLAQLAGSGALTLLGRPLGRCSGLPIRRHWGPGESGNPMPHGSSPAGALSTLFLGLVGACAPGPTDKWARAGGHIQAVGLTLGQPAPLGTGNGRSPRSRCSPGFHVGNQGPCARRMRLASR